MGLELTTTSTNKKHLNQLRVSHTFSPAWHTHTLARLFIYWVSRLWRFQITGSININSIWSTRRWSPGANVLQDVAVAPEARHVVREPSADHWTLVFVEVTHGAVQIRWKVRQLLLQTLSSAFSGQINNLDCLFWSETSRDKYLETILFYNSFGHKILDIKIAHSIYYRIMRSS